MSSLYVRNQIKDKLANDSAETVIDLSALFDDFQDVLDDAGITTTDPWVGLQFIGNSEDPITVPATNTSGKYRELGTVSFYVVDVAKLGVADSILARAEVLRDLFIGQRLGDMVIESVTMANFGIGTEISFEGGMTSAGFTLSYHRDRDL